MRLLSSGPEDPMNGLVRDDHPVFPTIAQPYVLPNAVDAPQMMSARSQARIRRKLSSFLYLFCV